jgi:hypothetical protein
MQHLREIGEPAFASIKPFLQRCNVIDDSRAHVRQRATHVINFLL